MELAIYIFGVCVVIVLYALIIGAAVAVTKMGVYKYFKDGREDSFHLWWGLTGIGMAFLFGLGLTLALVAIIP